jgi:hypothetical protein
MKNFNARLCCVAIICCFFSIIVTGVPFNGSHLAPELQKPIASPTPWIKDRIELLKEFPKHIRVAEIGVASGEYSESLFSVLEPEVLCLVDCWKALSHDEDPVHNWGQEVFDNMYREVIKKFAKHNNVRVIKECSKEAALLFPDQYFDVVYVDANHTYPGVSADLEVWLPKVKIGGIIAGHDYFCGAPDKPWTQYFGIVPAVNEFIKKHNLTIDYLTVEQVPSYAIRIR